MIYYGMKRRDDRAVSEAIGFIIIFSLVIVGIGLVSLYGYPVLLKQQTTADEKNMEQTMITIQNDVNLLCFGNTPYKNTALRVSSGSLTVYNQADSPGFFTILYGPDGGIPASPFTGTPLDNQVKTGELRYEANEGMGVISYENGAVMGRRTLYEGSYMIATPRWFVDVNPTTSARTLVLFITNIDSASTLSLAGIGNLELERTDEVYVLDVTATELGLPGPLHSISVEYNPPDPTSSNLKAWNTYALGIDDAATEISPNTIRYDNLDRTIIKVYNVTVRSL
jgi:hypothetical protein